jgi:hypothetical protein
LSGASTAATTMNATQLNLKKIWKMCKQHSQLGTETKQEHENEVPQSVVTKDDPNTRGPDPILFRISNSTWRD